MPTATELAVVEELQQLQDVALTQSGWSVTAVNGTSFRLGVPRKGGGKLWLHCDADQYPTLPPAWRWCGPSGEEPDSPKFSPIGGSTFFHGNGVICAPWNRLAYSSVDSRGPHGDWTIGDWKANPNTKECKTLAGMAIRIAVEAIARFSQMKG